MDGVRVTSSDFLKSGALATKMPRALADTIEKPLGTRGCISDRDTLAAQDTIDTLARIRDTLSTRRPAWGKVQLGVRGLLGYCPLVGIPPSPKPTRRRPCTKELFILLDGPAGN